NKEDNDSPVYKFASVYGNVGYMALPLTNAVLGSEGVFLGSSAVIVLNVLAFTHGIWLMNKSKHYKFNFKSIILSPGIISVIIGLPLFLLSVNLPEIITKPIGYIADLNTPLAMLILGTYIANTDIKNMFKLKEQYIIILIRLIAVPLLMLGFFKLINLDYTTAVACTIAAAAPSATNTVMFSVKYGKSSGTASKIVAMSSLVSIITLPVMIALAMQL
ncbi:MAG: AEC family transporter, partial [Clostridiales bacterium]|nr:AEC family transporter [Clostridiales bacterium]